MLLTNTIKRKNKIRFTDTEVIEIINNGIGLLQILPIVIANLAYENFGFGPVFSMREKIRNHRIYMFYANKFFNRFDSTFFDLDLLYLS